MSERRPLVLDSDGTIRELPTGDVLPGSGGSFVPIATADFIVPANTSAVAVDTLEISGTLTVAGNLGVM